MTASARWLTVIVAVGLVLGGWLTWAPSASAQSTAVCDPTTTCFDVTLPSGLVGDFYLGDALAAPGVNSARLSGAPATSLVISVRNLQEPGVAGFGDLYVYPDQSQASLQGLAGQIRLIRFTPAKNYVKGILSYICNPRGFKATDSVACRPAIDGTAMADVAAGATATYNLPPGPHTVHTDLVGDSAGNWSTVARDDSVTINAGTALAQTTRLSADFILKSLLQLSLYPANLLADWYVDGAQVATQVNTFSLYVAASVAHGVEAKNVQEPGAAGFGDVYNYADQSQSNVLAGPAQTRGVIFRPLKRYLKGALSYTCDPRGFKATDSVACRPTVDGTVMADVAPGATTTYNLPPGPHTVHTDLTGDSANNWGPILRDDAPVVNAGQSVLRTTVLRATFQLKALLKLSLSPQGLVADFFLNDAQIGAQVPAAELYVPAGTYTVQAKTVTDAAANGVYRFDDASASATVVASQIRPIMLLPKKVFLLGYLNVTCRINSTLPGDDVRCNVSADGQPLGVLEAGQTQKYTLATGTRALNVRLTGRNAALWAPISVDKSVNILGGGVSALFLTFDAKGRQLMARGMYQEAMALYVNVKATSQDPEVLAGADMGYQEALVALANAPAGQGALVVQNAIATACAGQPAGSPAVNLLKDQPGKDRVCNNAFVLPADLSATIPGTFRYVLVKETGTNEVERCDYTGGHTLVRVDNWMKIKLISTETGQVVTENTFWGSTAESCPYLHGFYSQTDYHYGGAPSMDDGYNWLREVR